MSVHLTARELMAAAGGLVVLVWAWRAGARRARAAADAARASVRVVSLAGQVLLTAALLGGVQWMVLTHPGSAWLTVAVLAGPDLFAAHVMIRALTVTAVDVRAVEGRAGRGRRSRRGGAR
ncbi:MAG TPA: hypothetical protein VFW65_03865 [Pseudonocardiaceae bacterium]|nr:hypothetical protein [Pseudonocardiaceae bacterium]